MVAGNGALGDCDGAVIDHRSPIASPIEAACRHDSVIGNGAASNIHGSRRVNDKARSDASETGNDRPKVTGDDAPVNLHIAIVNPHTSTHDRRIGYDRALADGNLASTNV